MLEPAGLEIEIVELEGETVLLFSWHTTKDTRRQVDLTAAEEDVLGCILRGASNAEIARARRTSQRTVANQVQALFGKFGVRSRYQLVAKLCSRGAAPATRASLRPDAAPGTRRAARSRA